MEACDPASKHCIWLRTQHAHAVPGALPGPEPRHQGACAIPVRQPPSVILSVILRALLPVPSRTGEHFERMALSVDRNRFRREGEGFDPALPRRHFVLQSTAERDRM